MEDRFNRFTLLINKIIRNIHKIKSEEMAKFGLKSTHVTCLYYLYKNGGEMTAKNLCDESDEDKAAISRAIDFLEKGGYVCCESSLTKRYNSPLVLSEKGEKIGKQIAEKIDGVIDEASKGIDIKRREILYACLDTIQENLQKICDGERR